MFSFFPTARVRPSPFFEAVVAEGMVAANVYNRMIMPTSFGDPEGE
ncbi:glycine cleavage system protein T, partial [Mesorhizobium sp. M4B.F.Ca.ET.143.01.1.1]